MEYDYSILIPTWKNVRFLETCIRSIRTHCTGNFQILIYANEAEEDVLSFLHEQDVEYKSSPHNIGICLAMNALRPLVKSELICYLNDDMYVLPGWDEVILQHVKGLEEPFFLSSTMIEATGGKHSVIQDFGGEMSSFSEDELLEFHLSVDCVDWSGSSWPPLWLSTSLWDKIGGFSEEFSPGMYSDPDMSMKAWVAGVRYFRGVGESRVYHFGRKSTGRLTGRNVGRERFLNKWGITANYFYKYYLRMGDTFTGPLSEPEHPFLGLFTNKLKRFLLGLKNH